MLCRKKLICSELSQFLVLYHTYVFHAVVGDLIIKCASNAVGCNILEKVLLIIHVTYGKDNQQLEKRGGLSVLYNPFIN